VNHFRAHLLALACAAHLVGAHAAPSNADLTSIHRKLNALRLQKQSAETNRHHVMNMLRQSEQAISNTNRALSELQQHEAQTETALNALHQQIDTTQRKLTRQQQELATLLHQLYFSGNTNPFQLWLNGDNPGQINRNITYTGYLSRQRDHDIAALQQSNRVLNDLNTQQQQLQMVLAQQRAQREQQYQQLKTEQAARQQVLKQLGTQIEQQQQKISTLEQDEQRVTQLLQTLARAAAIRKKTRTHVMHPPHSTGMYPKPLAEPQLPEEGLALLKGHLPMPTHGKLMHRFGTPREAGGTLWKGVFIQAPAGQPVSSVATGQVVFADWLRGFGNLIIIDHGGGYMSLYSDNETLYKRVGDNVKANEVIASVGNTGGNNETGLYFELRYRSQAFDPSSWLK
jgi:septal ring factor EnvC (AmiA/AmiB activator)